MPSLPDLLVFFTTVLGLALTPGPSWAPMLFYVESRNTAGVAFAVSGVATANFLFILGASSTKYLGVLLPPWVRIVLSGLGSIFLLVIAARLALRARKSASTDITLFHHAPNRSTHGNPFIESFMIHALNPNAWVFFVSIFLSTTHLTSTYWLGVLTLGIFVIFVDAFIMIVLAGFAHLFSISLSPAWPKGMLHISAICLLILGFRGLGRVIDTL